MMAQWTHALIAGKLFSDYRFSGDTLEQVIDRLLADSDRDRALRNLFLCVGALVWETLLDSQLQIEREFATLRSQLAAIEHETWRRIRQRANGAAGPLFSADTLEPDQSFEAYVNGGIGGF